MPFTPPPPLAKFGFVFFFINCPTLLPLPPPPGATSLIKKGESFIFLSAFNDAHRIFSNFSDLCSSYDVHGYPSLKMWANLGTNEYLILALSSIFCGMPHFTIIIASCSMYTLFSLSSTTLSFLHLILHNVIYMYAFFFLSCLISQLIFHHTIQSIFHHPFRFKGAGVKSYGMSRDVHSLTQFIRTSIKWGGGGKTKEISMKNTGVKGLITNRIIWNSKQTQKQKQVVHFPSHV